MCVYSMVTDFYRDRWINPQSPYPYTTSPALPFNHEQVEQFKRDMEEMRKLLEKARKYDEANGEKDCEMDEKKRQLRELAEKLGVPIVFPGEGERAHASWGEDD